MNVSTGALVLSGPHWHAFGMMTFQHEHMVRRGRPHRHRDAAGQLCGPDSRREPVPAQMREDVASPLKVYPKHPIRES